MDLNEYKNLLLAKERELSAEREADGVGARSLDADSAHETADQSVNDDIKSDLFTVGDLQWNVLQQVQEALERIDNGTYGKCAVDGRPIAEKRLRAIPWTRYCIKHEQQNEIGEPPPLTL